MSTGTNEVEIDPAALAREAAAIDLGAPPQDSPPQSGVEADPGAAPTAAPGEPSPEEVQSKAAQIEPVIAGVLAALHGVAAPAWTIDPPKMTALVKSSSLALVYWFPHELPPKYVALLMVGASLYGIAQDNRDPVTGAYKPMREAPKPAAAEADGVRTAQ